MQKLYVIVLSIIILLSALTGCYRYADENYSVPELTTTAPAELTTEPTASVSDTETTSETSLIYGMEYTTIVSEGGTTRIDTFIPMPPTIIDPKKIFEQGIDVERRALTYRVNSVKISKNTEGFKKDGITIDDLPEEDCFDSVDQLKLKPEFSYIILNLTIKNPNDYELETYIQNSIYSISESYQLDAGNSGRIGTSFWYGFVGFDKSQYKRTSRSFYLYKFQANDELTCNFLGIIRDTAFEYDLILALDIQNSDEYASTNYIKVYSKGE